MKIYNNISEFNSDRKSVVTIGTFDGVHHGHQKILQRVVNRAQADNLTSVLLTFFPHPRMVLQPDHDLKLINSIEERTELVKDQGIENMVIHPFSIEFSRTTAQEYVKEILVDQLKASVVVIGYDHRFGRNRSASIQELKEYASEYHFDIIEISKEEVEEVAVSSTKVRQSLESGEIERANRYLNRTYSLKGHVRSGKQIGRTIGYPTANLHVHQEYKLIPGNGVYITSSCINGKHFFGMTNIGVNPTIGNGNYRTIETYYLDFDGDLYDTSMELFFHKRLRDEKKFDTMQELVSAMDDDLKRTQDYARDDK